MQKCKYLIIGGGMTADAAVKGIRDLDEGGDITIIGDDPDPPYFRPPLSKGLWKKTPFEKIWCGTEDKNVRLVHPRRVKTLDPKSQQVTDSEGETYHYEKLLLATGGAPRRLSFGNDDIIYYRTCGDYRRLRDLADSKERFAVFGGGFIGSEIAAALAMNGKQVTLVFPEPSIAARVFPPRLSKSLNKYYESKGVRIAHGVKPSGLKAEKNAYTIQLDNSNTFSADGVIAGIGIVPNTELAEKAGLEVQNGIVVDEYLRASDPRIFAAGDVANYHSLQLGHRLRIEHEDNALTMGEAAGRIMAGEEKPYRHVPYFYSDLFDVGYNAIGETDPKNEILGDMDEAEGKTTLFYLREGRVRGVAFWNCSGDNDAARELIESPGPHTRESLAEWRKDQVKE